VLGIELDGRADLIETSTDSARGWKLAADKREMALLGYILLIKEKVLIAN
jgi:hypothetical protein